jgi:uroporphyrinogen decarboxylase
MLFRMDNYLTFLGLYPEKALRFAEKLCRAHLKSLEKWLPAVGPHIDIILFGDDLGGQTGPLISPRMYRQMIKPFHRKLWQRAKELADVKVMLHCCGGVRELMDDLIDAGVDAINPVQINAAGMHPTELKAEFGDRITFWGGGCDTRDILPHGSPAWVAGHVRALVQSLRIGGGYVFQQVHNILADVPADNVVAMFDAVNRQ